MTYTLKLHTSEDASTAACRAAEQRYRRALEAELGDASLVLPMHAAAQAILTRYGDHPDLAALTDAERHIFEQWQMAETAALTAALGPHRYLDDAWFEIGT